MANIFSQLRRIQRRYYHDEDADFEDTNNNSNYYYYNSSNSNNNNVHNSLYHSQFMRLCIPAGVATSSCYDNPATTAHETAIAMTVDATKKKFFQDFFLLQSSSTAAEFPQT